MSGNSSSPSSTTPTIDNAKLDSFMDKIFVNLGGTYVTLLCAISDRLNLFKDLATNGPATSQELAQRTKINECYAREWFSALTCTGYLELIQKTVVLFYHQNILQLLLMKEDRCLLPEPINNYLP